MAYIYMNFQKHLNDKDRKYKFDPYDSLNEQFLRIQRQLRNNGKSVESLENLVNLCLPALENRFYISMPSFDRELIDVKNGRQVLNNVVIRPEHHLVMEQCILKRYDILFIGDITLGGTVTEFTVRGIELMDVNVAKVGETTIDATPACALTSRRLNNGYYVPNYGTTELRDSVFTHDFIVQLTDTVFPIQDYNKAISTLEEWSQYIDFRKNYIEFIEQRFIELDDVEVCPAYCIKKNLYLANIYNYSEMLIDKGAPYRDRVYLDTQVDGSDLIYLVKLIFRKNKSQEEQTKVVYKGRAKSAFRSDLDKLVNRSVALSTIPAFSKDGFSSTLPLENRIMTFEMDIEPDYSRIEEYYSEEENRIEQELISKYEVLLDEVIKQHRKELVSRLAKQVELVITSFKEACKRNIVSLFDNHGDEEAEKAYSKELAATRERVNAQYAAERKKLNENIAKTKSKINALEKASQKKKDKKNASPEVADIEAQRVAQISELNATLNQYTLELTQLDDRIEQECNAVCDTIDRKKFYIQNAERLIEEKTLDAKFDAEKKEQEQMHAFRSEQKAIFDMEYKKELATEKAKLLRAKKSEIEALRKRETVREYVVYFKLETQEEFDRIQKMCGKQRYKYVVYDSRAEWARVRRQEDALTQLKKGYVKNPFLASYLFDPRGLRNVELRSSENIQWYNDRLNDRQRDAVAKALSSDSIFLLQGPPGTGKTEVIAELTAQFVRSGKKVLISSETHKAIDNVFERLPKIPDIRPVRLVRNGSNKYTDYSIDNLLVNFYKNVIDGLQRQITRYDDFESRKENFATDSAKLREQYNQAAHLQASYLRAEDKRQKLQRNREQLIAQKSKIEDNINNCQSEQLNLEAYISVFEKFIFSDNGLEHTEEYKSELESLLRTFPCFKQNISLIREIIAFDIEKCEEELLAISGENKELSNLKKKKEEIRIKRNSLKDPETDEPFEDKREEYDALGVKFRSLTARIKELEKNTDSISLDMLSLSRIVNDGVLLDADARKMLPEMLRKFHDEVDTIKAKYVLEYRTKLEDNSSEISRLGIEKSKINAQISDIDIKLREVADNSDAQEYQIIMSKLITNIRQFYSEFDIKRDYDPDNLQQALDIIEDEFKRLEVEFKQKKETNAIQIPMYKNIIKYLSQDVDDEEKCLYTADLFECANVFGLTCTAGGWFSTDMLGEAAKLGIESFDIRSANIDVVIVDEVSKSAFLDLLIPILYGKTVILVGDHRQLPPMYDLKNLREKDFEGSTSSLLTIEHNRRFTELFSTCYFKSMYESVPDCYRIMLNKQYRCHSDIMDIFNHFYGGSKDGLVIGTANQNDAKQHDLTVKIGGRTIIEPSKHIYFIDCSENEEIMDGSTSIYNVQEAKVVAKLDELIKRACIERDEQKRRETGGRKVKSLTRGIICTYGDQVRKVKELLRKKPNPKGKADFYDRTTISTVDDFQGDERDIIIVSMVRNPRENKNAGDFIKQYERINVAYSRARCLLIIVGNKNFLSKCTINLPDINGNSTLDMKAYPVYDRIIKTISSKGRILTAEDILIGDDDGEK